MAKISLALFLVLLIFGQSFFAQTVGEKPQVETEISESSNLKKQAEEMALAIQGNDYERFTDYMYPKLVELAGGRQKFIKILENASKEIASSGMEIKSYEVGKPLQTVKFKNEIFVVMPTEITMKISKDSSKLIKGKGILLAISEDRINWKFVRIDSEKRLRDLFPNIAGEIKLPADII